MGVAKRSASEMLPVAYEAVWRPERNHVPARSAVL